LDLSGDLPGELSFLAIQPETIALSAVKRAEGDDRLVVRFYNPTDEKVEAHLSTFLPILHAWEVNLNEEEVCTLPIQEARSIAVTVAGKEVKTVALELEG
jgi:mannosylglycerate hydrolase